MSLPSSSVSSSVSLDQVAPDAREVVAHFQASQRQLRQTPTLAEYRAGYRLVCRQEGLFEEVDEVRELSCPTADGASIALRFYRGRSLPAEQTGTGIFFIHGGGWTVGDLETHDSVCRLLANRVGACVVAVDYRLAPEHPFPGPVDDCRDALAYLVAHADELGIDLERLVVAGDSAGGNLSAILATQADYRPAGCQFQAQILIYPAVDLSKTYPSHHRITDGVPLTLGKMQWFKEQYLPAGADPHDRLLSPLLHLSAAPQPPMYILTLGLDPLADEGMAYARKAIECGHSVLHRHYPSYPHGILTSTGKVATGERIIDEIAHFIAGLGQPVGLS